MYSNLRSKVPKLAFEASQEEQFRKEFRDTVKNKTNNKPKTSQEKHYMNVYLAIEENIKEKGLGTYIVCNSDGLFWILKQQRRTKGKTKWKV